LSTNPIRRGSSNEQEPIDGKVLWTVFGVVFLIDVLRAIGGSANSRLWLQLKADVTGIPVVTPRITEATAFGAALLGGLGVGIFDSPGETAGQFLELTDTYEPDPVRHAAYSRYYELYREVYPAIAPISQRL
jgi:xylulokinase